MRYRFFLAPGALSLLLGSMVHGAVGDPRGAAVIANTTTAGDQQAPATASDARGGSVVVWTHADDGSDTGVGQRRFGSDGQPVGDETPVNLTTAGAQSAPRVAMSPDGVAAVVWVSDGQDGDRSGVFLRLFAADGSGQLLEIPVNQTTAANQDQPDVAWTGSGWIVAWTGDNQDGDGNGIAARRFTVDGRAASDEFTVNSAVTNSQSRPCVAAAPDGRFVIAWQSFAQDGDNNGIFAQAYAADGSRNGIEIAVNPEAANSQERCDVAMAADGSFVVAWSDFNFDLNGGGIAARAFDAGAAPLSGRVLVNQNTADNQTDPSIAIGADGPYWLAWRDLSGDADLGGIVARRLDRAAQPQGDEIGVNAITAGAQRDPSLAVDADGTPRISWTSDGEDGAGLGVVTRALQGPLAVDLSATLAVDPTTVRPGREVTMQAGIRNDTAGASPSGFAALDAGVGSATGLELALDLPAGAAFVSGSGDGWTCVGGVDCSRGESLDAGGSTAADLVITAPGTVGSHAFDLVVGGAEDDPGVVNNAATLNLLVAEPTGSLDAGATTLSENGGSVTLRFRVTPAAGAPVSFSFSLAGTATPGQDYRLASSSPVSVAAESTLTEVTLTAIDDQTHEGDETITVEVTALDGAASGSPLSLSLTLGDDDPAPVVTLSAEASVQETGSAVELTLNLDRAGSTDISVPFSVTGTATRGSDYSIAPTSPLVIPAGSTSTRLTVTPIDDLLTENDETVLIALGTPSGAVLGSASSARIVILDDERLLGPPSVRFVLAGQRVSEGAGSISLRARLSRALGEDISVPVSIDGTARSGRDFRVPTTSIAFPAGTSESELTIELIDDSTDEAEETVELRLQASGTVTVGTPGSHLLVIDDNDAAPEIRFDVAEQTVTERSTPLLIGVRLSNGSDFDVAAGLRVGGTATPGNDFDPIASEIRLRPGELSGTIEITGLNDAESEVDETLTLAFEGLRNARAGVPAATTITIRDRGTGGDDDGGSPGHAIGLLLLIALLRRRRSLPGLI